MVGLTAAVFVAAIGTVVGLLSGYFGGCVDAAADAHRRHRARRSRSCPSSSCWRASCGASTWNIVLAVALLLWPNTARVIRSQVLTVRERAYVEAARVTGASDWRILFVHVAPNILPLTFLYGSIAIGWAILTEASVSFLGFGDPTRVSWGYMLQDAFASQALSRGSYALVRAAGLLHRARRGRGLLHQPRLRGSLLPEAAD